MSDLGFLPATTLKKPQNGRRYQTFLVVLCLRGKMSCNRSKTLVDRIKLRVFGKNYMYSELMLCFQGKMSCVRGKIACYRGKMSCLRGKWCVIRIKLRMFRVKGELMEIKQLHVVLLMYIKALGWWSAWARPCRPRRAHVRAGRGSRTRTRAAPTHCELWTTSWNKRGRCHNQGQERTHRYRLQARGHWENRVCHTLPLQHERPIIRPMNDFNRVAELWVRHIPTFYRQYVKNI